MLSDNAPNFFAAKEADGRAKRPLEQPREDLTRHIGTAIVPVLQGRRPAVRQTRGCSPPSSC